MMDNAIFVRVTIFLTGHGEDRCLTPTQVHLYFKAYYFCALFAVIRTVVSRTLSC